MVTTPTTSTTTSYQRQLVKKLDSSSMTTTMFALVGTVLALVMFSAMALVFRLVNQGRRMVVSRLDAAEMVELSTDLITSVVSFALPFSTSLIIQC